MSTPPIIIKKKGGHGGHHGGAWKVAYADFVTAMMALFIVLWLLNSSKQIQEAVGGYFKDPTGTAKKVGTNQNGSGENFQLTKENMAQLKDQLQKSIHKINDLEKLRKNIEMTVTAEGLRIELLESDKGTFFDSGSSGLNDSGKEMLVLLAKELSGIPNHVSIEGHTDAKPYGERANYSNWELSSDRANAARRVMQQAGLRADQVSQVRGFADQCLRNKAAPLDASNRRISIIVQYIAPAGTEEDEKSPEHPAEAGTVHSPAEEHPARNSSDKK
ncbi:MAG TPA: flagellar motor protein MotB [Terriglobales bacterium]|nr:flagellar motor protein MotB [Terriglobales bacterium]